MIKGDIYFCGGLDQMKILQVDHKPCNGQTLDSFDSIDQDLLSRLAK